MLEPGMAGRELKLVFRPEAWSTSFVSGHDRRQSRGRERLDCWCWFLSSWVQAQRPNALISKEDQFFYAPWLLRKLTATYVNQRPHQNCRVLYKAMRADQLRILDASAGEW
jgi:hypothetical protein